jgi:hypothetical protein
MSIGAESANVACSLHRPYPFSMESNKDEALRCLAIAHKHRHAGNLPSALKFALKSISLFSTPEAVKLVAAINSETPSSSTSSATESHPSASGTHQRHTSSNSNAKTNGNGTAGGIGGEKREYTQEQHSVVKRVRGCKVTQYYEILEVKKDCEEVEIKKAYRKVSLPSCYSHKGLSDLHSWHWLYIQTRMALPVRMRHSKVCLFICIL